LGWTQENVTPFHGRYKRKLEFESAKFKQRFQWKNARLSKLLHVLLRLADDDTQPMASRAKALAVLGDLGSAADYCNHFDKDTGSATELRESPPSSTVGNSHDIHFHEFIEDISRRLFVQYVLHTDPHVAFTAATTLQLLLYEAYDGGAVVSKTNCKHLLPSFVEARDGEALLDRDSSHFSRGSQKPKWMHEDAGSTGLSGVEVRLRDLIPGGTQYPSDLRSKCLFFETSPAVAAASEASSSGSAASFADFAEFAESDLWVLTDASHYPVWICRLTASLAALSQSKSMQLLSEICALPQCQKLSEFMFPHIVHDLLSHASSGSAASRSGNGRGPGDNTKTTRGDIVSCLSHAFNRLITSGARGVVTLVIDTLLFLFNRSKQDFLALTERQRAEKRGQSYTGGQDSYNSIMLDVNLLQVVAAALRVGQPVTALLFFEAWCELPAQRSRCNPKGDGRLAFPENGTGVLGESVTAAAEFIGARRLLQAIYHAIGEEDANDSAATTALQGEVELQDFVSQYENSGSWLQLLEASDIMLSGAGPGNASHLPRVVQPDASLSSSSLAMPPFSASSFTPSGFPAASPLHKSGKDAHDPLWESASITTQASAVAGGGPSSSSSSLSHASLQLAICKSLHQLGLHHVLQPYIDTVRVDGASSAENQAVQQSMKEFKFELAWKCCQWNIADEGSRVGATLLQHGMQERELLESPPVGAIVSNHIGFHESLHRCLKSFSQADGIGFRTEVHSCRSRLLLRLRENDQAGKDYASIGESRSSNNAFKTFLMQLQCLLEMEEMWDFAQSQDLDGEGSQLARNSSLDARETKVARIVRKWEARSMLKMSADKSTQPVLHLRCILLKLCNLENEMSQALLQLSSAARKAKDFSVSRRCMQELANLRVGKVARPSADVPMLHLNVQVERSKIFWKSRETKAAMQMGRMLCAQLQPLLGAMDGFKKKKGPSEVMVAVAEKIFVVASALRRTGKWMAENKLDTTQIILDEYLRKAEQAVKKGQTFYTKHVKGAASSTISWEDHTSTNELIKSSRAKANLELAEFASALYEKVHDRIRSEEWKHAMEAAAMRKSELLKCQQELEQGANGTDGGGGSQKDLQEHLKKIKVYEKELRTDTDMESKQTLQVQRSESKFLVEAIKHFGKAMEYSRKPDLKAVFRTVSLWLRNADNSDVNKEMDSAVIANVSTHKFVPLSYQVCGRLSGENSPFQQQVEKLVTKMTVQHPHHLLPQLIALKNGERVEGNKAVDYSMIVSSKAKAAEALMDKIVAANNHLGGLFAAMGTLTDAYIALAGVDGKSLRKTRSIVRTETVLLY
jgi:hypothetical protein